MRKILLILFCLLSCRLIAAETPMEWFTRAKLGLFLHWGLYSQTAGDWKGHPAKGGEHFMLYERIPLKEYARIADNFNPTDFDASKWVKAAKYAGMQYIVITSKHHDGFAMYNSACSDYNIVQRTPFAKDPIKVLAEACREEGIKLGFYYSLGRDWEDPDVPTNWPVKAGRSNTWDYPDEDAKQLPAYIERKVKPQLRELLANYGEVAMIWFDTPEMVTKQQSKELRELIHSLQPDCLINGRIGNGMGDYSIVEQSLTNKINSKPWEACLTMGKNWCYNRHDTIYKRPDVMIRNFVDVVSKGGNLLLNIGPDEKGCFPELTQAGLEAFHRWLKTNGEAIYGSSPWRTFGETLSTEPVIEKRINSTFHDAVYDGTPKEIISDVRYTTKEKVVYAIFRHVPNGVYTLRSFTSTDVIKSVILLENDKAVSWKQVAEGLEIKMPSRPQKAFPVYVLKITTI